MKMNRKKARRHPSLTNRLCHRVQQTEEAREELVVLGLRGNLQCRKRNRDTVEQRVFRISCSQKLTGYLRGSSN